MEVPLNQHFLVCRISFQRLMHHYHQHYYQNLQAISLKSQREAFKNAQESYNLGASTLFDFDLVRTRLVSAESALIRAKYDFVFKTKVLQFYNGNLNLD